MKRFLNTIILSCIAIMASAWWDNINFYTAHFTDGTKLRGIVTRSYTENYMTKATDGKEGNVMFYFNDENLYAYNQRIIDEQEQNRHTLFIKHTGRDENWKFNGSRDGFILLQDVDHIKECYPPQYYTVYFTDGTVVENFVHSCSDGIRFAVCYKGQAHFFTDNGEDLNHNRLLIQKYNLADNYVAYLGKDDEVAKKYHSWKLTLKNVDRIERTTDTSCWW